MDTAKILIILCCFILIVCLTLAISTLTVFRNAIEESRVSQSEADALIDRVDQLVQAFWESSIPVSGGANGEAEAAFYLYNVNGQVGIYTADGFLLKILDLRIDSLPAADREALCEGIHLGSWSELIEWVQDYTS